MEEQDPAQVTVAVPAQRGPKNPAEVGVIAEAYVQARLVELGYEVYVPIGHGTRADLVYKDPSRGRLIEVQVKTGRMLNGCVVFQTCSINGFTGKKTSYQGQLDEFMVWCPATRKVYRVPVSECGVSSAALRVDTPKGGSKSTIRWAKDYEL